MNAESTGSYDNVATTPLDDHNTQFSIGFLRCRKILVTVVSFLVYHVAFITL